MKDQWNREQPVQKLTGDGPPVRILMSEGVWCVPPDQRPPVPPAPQEHGPDLIPYHTFTKGEKR